MCRILENTSRSNRARFARRPKGTVLPDCSMRVAWRPASMAASAILRRRSLGSSARAARIPARSFSHNLGTPAKASGLTSGARLNTSRTSGQKYTWAALYTDR